MNIRGAIEIACDAAAFVGRWRADRSLGRAERWQDFVIACNRFKRRNDAVAVVIYAFAICTATAALLAIAFNGVME